MLKLFLGVAPAAIILACALVVFAPLRAFASQCGPASFYAEAHQGRTMANGKPFDMWAMTAASNSFPLGSVVLVRNTANGRSVQVRITDTGGFAKYGRILDMSKGAFGRIAPTSQGIIKQVCIDRLS